MTEQKTTVEENLTYFYIDPTKATEANEPASLFFVAANHDPQAFPDPDTFRLDRKKNPHLAFSAGPHFSMAAQRARLEARLVMEALVRRLPGDEVERSRSGGATLFTSARWASFRWSGEVHQRAWLTANLSWVGLGVYGRWPTQGEWKWDIL